MPVVPLSVDDIVKSVIPVVVVLNVWDDAVIVFKFVSPFADHIALPLPSFVNTVPALVALATPVKLNAVADIIPLLILVVPFNVPPVIVGLVANTKEPLPVDVLAPVPPLSTLNGVVKLNDVAVIVPAFILVALVVPLNIAPLNVGLVANTTDPFPVDVLAPVPPLTTLNGVVKLNVPELIDVAVAIPNVGVISVGLVANTTDPLPVDVLVPVPPLVTLNGVVKLIVPALIIVALVVPLNIAPLSVGLVANTIDPLPVSSVTAAAKFALVGVAKNDWTPVPKVNAFCFALNVL